MHALKKQLLYLACLVLLSIVTLTFFEISQPTEYMCTPEYAKAARAELGGYSGDGCSLYSRVAESTVFLYILPVMVLSLAFIVIIPRLIYALLKDRYLLIPLYTGILKVTNVVLTFWALGALIMSVLSY